MNPLMLLWDFVVTDNVIVSTLDITEDMWVFDVSEFDFSDDLSLMD